jgi:hypothetical protein
MSAPPLNAETIGQVSDDVILTALYSTFEDVLQKRLEPEAEYSTNIPDIESVRSRLSFGVDELLREITFIGDAQLSATFDHLRDAIAMLSSGANVAREVVLQSMQKSFDTAVSIAQSTCSIEGKLIAIRLRILAVLYIHGYFESGQTGGIQTVDMVLVRAAFSTAFIELTRLPPVADAISFFYESRKWSLFKHEALQAQHRKLIVNLANIRHCLYKFSGVPFDIHVKNHEIADLDVLCRKPHMVLKGHAQSVLCLALNR